MRLYQLERHVTELKYVQLFHVITKLPRILFRLMAPLIRFNSQVKNILRLTKPERNRTTNKYIWKLKGLELSPIYLIVFHYKCHVIPDICSPIHEDKPDSGSFYYASVTVFGTNARIINGSQCTAAAARTTWHKFAFLLTELMFSK